MRFGLVRHIREKAGKLAYNSPFYNWSLGGAIPDSIVFSPQDSWPGDVDRGRWLCSGTLISDGESLALYDDCWRPAGITKAWLYHLHGFSWLRDLKALGGDSARQQARNMIGGWIRINNRWEQDIWSPGVTGQRVSNWIALYNFFGDSAGVDFQENFIESLIRQSRHISRSAQNMVEGVGKLYGLKGLAYSGLAFKGREAWLYQALDILEAELDKQILSDGGHISRSPGQLVETLQITVDIRSSLLAAGYSVPQEIEHLIDRMAQAVRFFRYPDKGLAVFNGSQQGHSGVIDATLTRSNVRGRVLKSLPSSGYERLTVGRSILMVDVGKTPPWPYDNIAHAAPLAFEFMYGKERVFVSCGTNPMDQSWQDVLRSTSAHNTLSIDYRDACEISTDGHFSRKPRIITFMREDGKEGTLIEASHDGYVSLNGISHRRRLFLSSQGHDLRGEEMLTCSVGKEKSSKIALRFHLHPDVSVALTRSGKEVLIRLSGGAGWRFVHSAGLVSVEDSIYIGEGVRPRKSKQIVIYGQMDLDHALIKWVLQREMR